MNQITNEHAKRSGKINLCALLPKSGDHWISVDTLVRSSDDKCAYTCENVRVAKERGTLFGWGYSTRKSIEDNTPCKVLPEAIPEHPNHVKIEFPKFIIGCNKRRNEIAQELASISTWLPYCPNSNESKPI